MTSSSVSTRISSLASTSHPTSPSAGPSSFRKVPRPATRGALCAHHWLSAHSRLVILTAKFSLLQSANIGSVSSRCFADLLRKISKSDFAIRRRKLRCGDRGAVTGRWFDISSIFRRKRAGLRNVSGLVVSCFSLSSRDQGQ